MNGPLVSIDVESTGLIHGIRQITEIGMVRRDEALMDNDDTHVEFFVEVDLQEADSFALRLNHFYDRHPLGRWLSGKDKGSKPEPDGKHYLTRTQAAYAVAQGTHGAHLLGLAPSALDIDLLTRLLQDEFLTHAWHHHVIDAEALMLGYLRAGGYEIELPWKSDVLAEALGIGEPPEDVRHTALGDAIWTMQMWDRIAIG